MSHAMSGDSRRIEHPKPEISEQAIPEMIEHIIPEYKYQNTNIL